MKTLNEQKQALESEHNQAIADLERKAAIRASLPEQYQADALICIHSKFASVKLWNDFRTLKKLSDAVEIVLLYQPHILTCGHWKSGCISTWPDAINSYINDEKAIMDGSHVVEIDVHGGKGFGPNVEVQFWADVPGLGLIELTLPVCDLQKLVPNVDARYDNFGHMTSCKITWPAETQCADSFRKWWSEKPAYQGNYYLADVPNFLSWAGAINAPKSAPIN